MSFLLFLYHFEKPICQNFPGNFYFVHTTYQNKYNWKLMEKLNNCCYVNIYMSPNKLEKFLDMKDDNKCCVYRTYLNPNVNVELLKL